MMTMRSRLRSKQVWKKSKVPLGKGDYGAVHLVHQCGCSSGAPLAVKSALEGSVESLKWEDSVMRQLIGAPNVVDCYGDDVCNGVYSLLLEYAPCGTLRDLIGSPFSHGRAPRCVLSCLTASLTSILGIRPLRFEAL